MIEKLRFYLSHSFNDLRVNQRLTFFAVLSIAAGVAAIVSLQTLSLMIGDTLEQNLQSGNRGDVSAQVMEGFGSEQESNNDETLAPSGNISETNGLSSYVEAGTLQEETIVFFGQSAPIYSLSSQGIEEIQSWIDSGEFAGEAEFTYRIAMSNFFAIFTGSGRGTTLSSTETEAQASQVSPVVINPSEYPYYSEIKTIDGQNLADVLQSSTDIVVGQNVADDMSLEIGDTLTISGSSAIFTVKGVVAIENEVRNPVTDIFAGLYGFYYISWDAVSSFEDFAVSTDLVYFQLTDPSRVSAFDEAFHKEFPFFETTSIDDLREQNEEIVGQLKQLTTIIGLVSLLLGSIGIINTMQVIVRRRMLEVAVLKTIGMQSEQITFLFLTEAFLLGVLGSLAGIILGWLGTFIIKGGIEATLGVVLPFRIAMSPALNGFIVGTIVATVFGFLPTLAAGQVRPGIVLRPAQGIIPKAGLLQSLAAIALIIVVISLIAQSILGNFALALGVVAGAFFAAAWVYAILWVIIWLIGRLFPSFGIVDLKVSLRQMLAAKGRGASTLLALVVGVFSLSLITLFAQAFNNILSLELANVGGNVIVSVQNYNRLDAVEEKLNSLEGLNGYSVSLAYNAELLSWEDVESDTVVVGDELVSYALEQNLDFPPFFQGTDEERAEIQQEIFDATLVNVAIEAYDVNQISEENMVLGRDLNNEDAGQARLVMEGTSLLTDLGFSPGDKLTYRITSAGLFGNRSEDITFELVGLRVQDTMQLNTGTGVRAPAGIFPENFSPSTISMLVDIDEEQIGALRQAIAEVPGTFAIPTSIFTQLIESLLGTFTVFPLLVATLGLIVGGVVIANSVALSTMERQHEIAVMKAVGLQRERVLGMLLLENGFLGFVGGLLGVGIGLINLVIITSSADIPLDAIPWGTAFLLMSLCIGVSLIAALTSAWSASGEKPLTVLRYE